MKVLKEILGVSLIFLGGLVLLFGYVLPYLSTAALSTSDISQLKDAGVVLVFAGIVTQITLSQMK